MSFGINNLLTPEIQLPPRQELVSHVISSLSMYWEKSSVPVLKLPISDLQSEFTISLPLKLHAIEVPHWAASCGFNNLILVPRECVPNNCSQTDWQKVDWWLAIFLMLEGWHERIWEKVHGCIHSYSFRLKDWDTRAWDHAWVNRICLFLRLWCNNQFQASSEHLGLLPKAELIMSHDVDAVSKTHAIRIKQSAFHFLNSIVLLLKLRVIESAKRLSKGIKFLLSSEDWWVFDKLLKMEENAGIKAIFHFYADQRPKTLKRWLMDPSYDLDSDRLKSLLCQIYKIGHKVGLHPTYDSWNDSELLEEQRQILEQKLGSSVTHCRQHWLRFSWENTWTKQEQAGLRYDSTLMFNDRAGFRNSTASTWQPWNNLQGNKYRIKCTTSIFMDSHFFDYAIFSEAKRGEHLNFFLNECREVSGKAFLLWHPHTLTKDYGWEGLFRKLIAQIN